LEKKGKGRWAACIIEKKEMRKRKKSPKGCFLYSRRNCFKRGTTGRRKGGVRKILRLR